MSIQSTLDIWHEIVAAKDIERLPTIIHADAVFRSPFAFKPYPSRAALVFVLTQVLEIFEDFTYHREMVCDESQSAFLEFSANIGDKTLKGIDMVRFDQEGLITEFEVMIRPMSGLMALAEQMAPRMAKIGL